MEEKTEDMKILAESNETEKQVKESQQIQRQVL